jgi:hypothetical protein
MDKKIIQQIFNYGLREKYNLFLIENRYYNNLIITKPGDPTPKDSSPLTSENQLLYILNNKHISGFKCEHKDFHVNAFIDIYNSNNTEEQKFMLSNITEYLGYSWNDNIIYVLGKTTKNYKDVVNVVNGFSITTLHISRVNLKELDNILESFNPKAEDLYKFWLKFFKQRKNQVKNAMYGPVMSKFLLNKYGRDQEKLSPFCELSNSLKSEFEELEFQLEEDSAKYVTAFRVNCRKASQLLSIPNYTEGRIQNEIGKFMYGLKNIWNLEKIDVVDFDRHKGIVEFRIYNSQKQYSQEEVTSLVKEFLVYKKRVPELDTTDVLVNNWMLQRELSSVLSNEKNILVKKNKI